MVQLENLDWMPVAQDNDDGEDFLDEQDMKMEPRIMTDMEMIDPSEGVETFDMRGSVQANTGEQVSNNNSQFLKILASQGVTDP